MYFTVAGHCLPDTRGVQIKEGKLVRRIALLVLPVSMVLWLAALSYAESPEHEPTSSLRIAMGDMKTEERPARERDRPPRTANAKPAPQAPIVWTPPVNGAPRVRVAGGVRGTTALPTPTALVPEYVGLTTQRAPSFFWHIDAGIPEGTRLFFTLVEEEAGLPLIEVELDPPAVPGIQRVRLLEHGMELAPGITYAWSIALVPDMKHRSADLVTTGYVERVTRANPSSLDAQHFAAEGLWYDALEVLSDAVEDRPETDTSRSQRRSLLRQAGLGMTIE